MRNHSDKVSRYRREASRCAELAKTAEPYFLRGIYRKTAVRYALMVEDLERPNAAMSLVDRAEEVLGILNTAVATSQAA
jgi:hypothetical protein